MGLTCAPPLTNQGVESFERAVVREHLATRLGNCFSVRVGAIAGVVRRRRSLKIVVSDEAHVELPTARSPVVGRRGDDSALGTQECRYRRGCQA